MQSLIRWSYEVQRLKLGRRFTISRGSSLYRDTVRVQAEVGGQVGWGEAAPNARHGESVEGVLHCLDELSCGAPAGSRHFLSFLQEAEEILAPSRAAHAGVEIALLDAHCKQLGVPLHHFLGVDPSRMKPTSQTIGIGSPQEVAEWVAASSEFKVLKVKLGGEEDRAAIHAIRALSAQPLRIDANEGWRDVEAAAREIEWLAGQNVELVEQPLPAHLHEEMVWLRERSPLPLFADEAVSTISDLNGIAEAYDGINIKLMKCGGVMNALAMLWLARELGLTAMLGCMVESSCGIAAAAHIAPLFDAVDLDSNLIVVNDPFEGPKIVDGVLRLSDEPGLGVSRSKRIDPLAGPDEADS